MLSLIISQINSEAVNHILHNGKFSQLITFNSNMMAEISPVISSPGFLVLPTCYDLLSISKLYWIMIACSQSQRVYHELRLPIHLSVVIHGTTKQDTHEARKVTTFLATFIKFSDSEVIHVGWVPCHHSMTCPQVADGGKSSGYGG
jgi:hypothetical protein